MALSDTGSTRMSAAGMNFEELDALTRQNMLEEFEVEETGGNPYRGKDLSVAGLAAFPALMRTAIVEGTDDTLATSLAVTVYWNPTEPYTRSGITRERRINLGQAAERLAVMSSTRDTSVGSANA